MVKSILKRNKISKVYILSGLYLVLGGSFASVSKLTIKNIDSFQLLFFMFATALIVMSFQFGFTGEFKELLRIKVKDIAIISAFSVPSYLYYLLYFLAVKHIPAIEVSMLNYLFPIFIIMFAVPINKEKLSAINLITVFLGFAGMAIIVTAGQLFSLRLTNIAGDMFALAAAVCWALFSVLGKRNRINILHSNYIYALINFLFSIISLMLFSKIIKPDFGAIIGILWIALTNIVICYYLWFRILKLTSAAFVSTISFMLPFVTFTFIALLLKESFAWYHILGFALVVSGIVIQNAYADKTKRN